MDLKKFYFQNIKESDYHYRFYDTLKQVNGDNNIFDEYGEVDDYEFEVFDTEEGISKFKELCEPYEDLSSNERKCWFYLVTFFLYKTGYVIKEFPGLLARPPINPNDFTYRDIRNRIIAQGGDDNGTVRYATRRTFAAALTFELKSKHIAIDTSLEQKFIQISNRQASFNSMSTDEKLAEIANMIENMLKMDGHFITPDYYSICFDYISNESVASYRKKMQCFRHASVEAITERNLYTEKQKNFFVDFGLTIIKVIYALIN